jgi:hypothetical protein
MSGTGDLPAHVVELIREHIHSIEALEVVLLLRRDAPRSWTAPRLADELKASQNAIGATMPHLLESQIVGQEGSDARMRYVYVAQGKLAQSVADLDQLYATDRFEVLQAIASNAISRVRKNARRAFPGVFRPGGGREEE